MCVVVVHVDTIDDGQGTERNSVSLANGMKWDQDLKGFFEMKVC